MVKHLRDEEHSQGLDHWLEQTFGGEDGAVRAVLCDFFKHAFDGSGGDNMNDAGSCIDGRLTSAWHWCQTIRQKLFYLVFLLSGFSSFDDVRQ